MGNAPVLDEAAVLRLLRGVAAPEGGDVVAAGLVDSVSVKDGAVQVALRTDRARLHAMEQAAVSDGLIQVNVGGMVRQASGLLRQVGHEGAGPIGRSGVKCGLGHACPIRCSNSDDKVAF